MKLQKLIVLFGFGWLTTPIQGQPIPGLPEPGILLYGVVQNVRGETKTRMIVGHLSWTIQPANGAPVTIETELRNINDQFSYAIQVPFETVLEGFTLSANTLELTPTESSYTRSAIVDGEPATIVAPAQDSFVFSRTFRGRFDRVDLEVSVTSNDTDGDGLPDAWETQFGLNPNLAADALTDLDGDGLSNEEEFQAGTDPADDQSQFRIIKIQTSNLGGIQIEWDSVDGKVYSVERSTNLFFGFQAIASEIDGAAPKNVFIDLDATGAGPFFYRMRVE